MELKNKKKKSYILQFIGLGKLTGKGKIKYKYAERVDIGTKYDIFCAAEALRINFHAFMNRSKMKKNKIVNARILVERKKQGEGFNLRCTYVFGWEISVA